MGSFLACHCQYPMTSFKSQGGNSCSICGSQGGRRKKNWKTKPNKNKTPSHNTKALNVCWGASSLFREDDTCSINSLATEFNDTPEVEGWLAPWWCACTASVTSWVHTPCTALERVWGIYGKRQEFRTTSNSHWLLRISTKGLGDEASHKFGFEKEKKYIKTKYLYLEA